MRRIAAKIHSPRSTGFHKYPGEIPFKQFDHAYLHSSVAGYNWEYNKWSAENDFNSIMDRVIRRAAIKNQRIIDQEKIWTNTLISSQALGEPPANKEKLRDYPIIQIIYNNELIQSLSNIKDILSWDKKAALYGLEDEHLREAYRNNRKFEMQDYTKLAELVRDSARLIDIANFDTTVYPEFKQKIQEIANSTIDFNSRKDYSLWQKQLAKGNLPATLGKGFEVLTAYVLNGIKKDVVDSINTDSFAALVGKKGALTDIGLSRAPDVAEGLKAGLSLKFRRDNAFTLERTVTLTDMFKENAYTFYNPSQGWITDIDEVSNLVNAITYFYLNAATLRRFGTSVYGEAQLNNAWGKMQTLLDLWIGISLLQTAFWNNGRNMKPFNLQFTKDSLQNRITSEQQNMEDVPLIILTKQDAYWTYSLFNYYNKQFFNKRLTDVDRSAFRLESIANIVPQYDELKKLYKAKARILKRDDGDTIYGSLVSNLPNNQRNLMQKTWDKAVEALNKGRQYSLKLHLKSNQYYNN